MPRTTFTDCGTLYEITTDDADDTVVKRETEILYQGPARPLLGAPGEYYAITTQPYIDDDTVVREHIAETLELHLFGPAHAAERRDAASFRTFEYIADASPIRVRPGRVAQVLAHNIRQILEAGEDTDPLTVF